MSKFAEFFFQNLQNFFVKICRFFCGKFRIFFVIISKKIFVEILRIFCRNLQNFRTPKFSEFFIEILGNYCPFFLYFLVQDLKFSLLQYCVKNTNFFAKHLAILLHGTYPLQSFLINFTSFLGFYHFFFPGRFFFWKMDLSYGNAYFICWILLFNWFQ